MSKITFRVDDDLMKELESVDSSKSEVIREALSCHLNNDKSSYSNVLDDARKLYSLGVSLHNRDVAMYAGDIIYSLDSDEGEVYAEQAAKLDDIDHWL